MQLADGTVVVGSTDHHVYFLNPELMDEWSDTERIP
jgi:acyl-CoA thioesterase